MTNDEITKFESGYNEGFFYAAQAVASAVLRLIDNHPRWMLDPDRRQAKAEIKLATKRILQKRGLIPYSYDVMMGKAEDVPVDFNLQY
ncbi:MAG: hypothetical protein IJT83_14245 [Victivallales bacterium]|nr:hypothetical protein [Victivallales bacterium]